MTKEELYLSILDNIQDGVYYVDIHRKIKFWNKGAEQITGYQADEMLGLECSESKLNHIDEFGNHLCITGCPLFATNIDGVVRTERVFVRHKNGYRIPLLGRNMVSTDVSAENIRMERICKGKILWNIQQFIMTWTKDSVTQLIRICL